MQNAWPPRGGAGPPRRALKAAHRAKKVRAGGPGLFVTRRTQRAGRGGVPSRRGALFRQVSPSRRVRRAFSFAHVTRTRVGPSLEQLAPDPPSPAGSTPRAPPHASVRHATARGLKLVPRRAHAALWSLDDGRASRVVFTAMLRAGHAPAACAGSCRSASSAQRTGTNSAAPLLGASKLLGFSILRRRLLSAPAPPPARRGRREYVCHASCSPRSSGEVRPVLSLVSL